MLTVVVYIRELNTLLNAVLVLLFFLFVKAKKGHHFPNYVEYSSMHTT